jgi:hypothetical protein
MFSFALKMIGLSVFQNQIMPRGFLAKSGVDNQEYFDTIKTDERVPRPIRIR